MSQTRITSPEVHPSNDEPILAEDLIEEVSSESVSSDGTSLLGSIGSPDDARRGFAADEHRRTTNPSRFLAAYEGWRAL